MRVVQLAPRAPFRWLAVSAAAAAAVLAWRAHRRPAAPTPPIFCPVQSMPATPPVDQLQVRPHFAVPPPGDPYPRPRREEEAGLSVNAELIARDGRAPACGSLTVWSIATFRPTPTRGIGDVRALVPCAEQLRPHSIYHLDLGPADDAADGKNDVLWRAQYLVKISLR